MKFKSSNVNAVINGGSYVTSTPELEQATLEEFLGQGHEESEGSSTPAPAHPSSHHTHSHPHVISARSAGMVHTNGESEVVKAALGVPFRVLYPAYQTAPSSQETTRQYAMRDEHGHLHQAYVVVWRQNGIDGYYDFEGTNWLNPPLFAHARERKLHGRDYKLVYDGSHIHVIGWREGNVLYWVTNTLLGGPVERPDVGDRQIRPEPALSARRAPVQSECASRVWLTSASACAFWARGTVRIDHRSKRPKAASAWAWSGRMAAFLTL